MKITVSMLAPIARDVVGFSGIGLIVEGVREIYAPAGLIVAGSCLVAGAMLQARRG